MKAEMREFLRGAWGLGPGWRVWQALLLAANAVAPWFFLPRLTAIVTLVATATALPVALVLIRVQGKFTKLQGIIHAPWVPMLATLLLLYPWDAEFDAYRIWLSCSIAMTVVSLAIDASDVYRFFKQ